MATFFDDFSSYSTGNISSVATANWSVQAAGAADWTQTINDDAGNKVAVLTRTTAAAANNVIVHDTAGVQSGDVEVVARFKFDMTTTVAGAVGPVLVAADAQSYGWSVTGATSVRLVRFSTSLQASTNIAIGVTFTIPDQGFLWVRIGRSGTTIRAKIWLDGDAEPGSWTSQGTNTTLTDVKAGFVARAIQQVPLTVDVFGIGTAGSAAPTSPPGTDINATTQALALTELAAVLGIDKNLNATKQSLSIAPRVATKRLARNIVAGSPQALNQAERTAAVTFGSGIHATMQSLNQIERIATKKLSRAIAAAVQVMQLNELTAPVQVGTTVVRVLTYQAAEDTLLRM